MSITSILWVISALALVLAMIIAALRFLQWRLRPAIRPTARSLTCIETIALDPRRRLHLLQCGSRRVLILTGGGHDLVVGWITEA